MLVGTWVQGLGQVVPSSLKPGAGGPIGLFESLGEKMEMISPGETASLMKLAALVTPLICGSGALIVRFTWTMVEPVAGLVPVTVTVPEYGVELGSRLERAEATSDTVTGTVPVFGVVPDV